MLMLRLMRRRGRGLLVNDLVSSVSLPNLASVRASELPSLMDRVIRAGNFFTGCNPYAICAQLEDDPDLSPSVTDIISHEPWVWTMGSTMHRLVYAISFRRVAG